jgi:hypothetical protein
MFKWQEDYQVEWHYITRGKPMQHGFVEIRNGRIQEERLNEHIFKGVRHSGHLTVACAMPVVTNALTNAATP